MNTSKFRSLSLSILFGVLFSAQPAMAGTMEEGVKYYKAGDYVKARQQFEQTIATNPMGWTGHYYLANTYLALGQYSMAKHEYMTTEKLCQNQKIHLQCQAGLDRINRQLSQNRAAPAADPKDAKASSETPAPDAKKGDAKASTEAPASKGPKTETEKRREEVMNKAKEEVAKVKKEARDQIENEKANSSDRLRFEEGARAIPEEREKEILQEAEEKAKKIMEEAQRKSRLIH